MTRRLLLTTGRPTTVINLYGNVWYPNIRQLALNAGWDGFGAIILNVNSGADVAHLRILVENIPHDCLTINNYGTIGGVSAGLFVTDPGAGIYTTSRIRINNTNYIFGAGGAGGYGGDAYGYYQQDPGSPLSGWGGSGGNGAGYYSSNNGATFTYIQASGGSAGSYERYSGAVLGGHEAPWVQGGYGGNGGAVGQPGTAGGIGTYGGTISGAGATFGSNGAPGGPAVKGNNFVTWLAVGTLAGGAVT